MEGPLADGGGGGGGVAAAAAAAEAAGSGDELAPAGRTSSLDQEGSEAAAEEEEEEDDDDEAAAYPRSDEDTEPDEWARLVSLPPGAMGLGSDPDDSGSGLDEKADGEPHDNDDDSKEEDTGAGLGEDAAAAQRRGRRRPWRGNGDLARLDVPREESPALAAVPAPGESRSRRSDALSRLAANTSSTLYHSALAGVLGAPETSAPSLPDLARSATLDVPSLQSSDGGYFPVWLDEDFRGRLAGMPAPVVSAVTTGLCCSPAARHVLLNLRLTPPRRADELVHVLAETLSHLFGLRARVLYCSPHTQPSDLWQNGPYRQPSTPPAPSAGPRDAAADDDDDDEPRPRHGRARRRRERSNSLSGDEELLGGVAFAPLAVLHNVHLLPQRTLDYVMQAMETRELAVNGKVRVLPAVQCFVATYRAGAPYTLPRQLCDQFVVEVVPDAQFMPAVARYARETLPRVPLPAVPWVEMRAAFAGVYASHAVLQYARDIVTCARQHSHVLLGPSVHGGGALLDAARAHALMQGETYVRPLDVDRTALAALAHRLVLRQPAPLSAREVVHHLVTSVLVPPK